MKCWHEAFVLHKMQCQCWLVSAVLPCVSFCWNRKIHLEKITQSRVGLITLSLCFSLARSLTTCTPNTPTILCSVSRPAKHPSSQPAIEPTRQLVFVNKMLGYNNNKQTNKQQFHATLSNSGPAAFGWMCVVCFFFSHSALAFVWYVRSIDRSIHRSSFRLITESGPTEKKRNKCHLNDHRPPLDLMWNDKKYEAIH